MCLLMFNLQQEEQLQQVGFFMIIDHTLNVFILGDINTVVTFRSAPGGEDAISRV